MTPRLRRTIAAAAILAIAAAGPSTAPAQDARERAQDAGEPARLLDLPYLPQSEALCGGAAAAMVMRFFGARDIFADSFAHLVGGDPAGIRGEDLIGDLRRRGWLAESFAGDASLVRQQLRARRPAIALIEDRPGRLHYVVIVGWVRERVVVHDPARAPFRVFREDAFLQAWKPSGFWLLIAAPGEQTAAVAAAAPVTAAPVTAAPTDACGGMVTEGVRLAGTGDVARAERVLSTAAELCPDQSGPLRELAGVHVLRRQWAAAEEHARQALKRDASDSHAARILATSLYLEDKPEAALEVWNALGEPAIDLIDIAGLERTRYDVVARTLGLQPRQLLTTENLATGRRRLEELPSSLLSRVSFTPQQGGRATVNAVVVERPSVPWGWIPLAVTGAHALTDREVAVSLASLTGGGELVKVLWRWWQHRPRVAFDFVAPSPSRRLGTTWSMRVSEEDQTYGRTGEIVEKRQRAVFAVTDWPASSLRLEAGAGAERWSRRGTSLSVYGDVHVHARDDRLRVGLRGGGWIGGTRAAASRADIVWRSSTRQEQAVWIAGAGAEWTGSSSPFGLWAGAGSGQGREPLLRAHSLIDDGIVRGGVFGRSLAHATVEWRYWIRPAARPWRLAPAAFVDVARAGRTTSDFDARAHADLGVGLRVAVPGGGVFRIDLAQGLRDGATRVSAGWGR